MAHSVPQGELDCSSDRVGAGLGLASQSLSETVGGGGVGPAGSGVWVSDNWATNHITSSSRNMYDCVEIPRGKEQVLLGDGKAMRVLGVGSLNLKMHSKTDFNVKLSDVYVTEGIRFNLFLLHDAQARQSITLDKDRATSFDNHLSFPRDATGSNLCATRMNLTPTTGLTADRMKNCETSIYVPDIPFSPFAPLCVSVSTFILLFAFFYVLRFFGIFLFVICLLLRMQESAVDNAMPLSSYGCI